MTFLLIPPYLIFAFFVMWRVLKKQPDRKRKWRMGLLTAFLLYLPFGWDVILGRAVFYTLCATQGGVHVYQTVELGPEYWNEDGSPKFITSDGWFDDSIFNGKYDFDSVYERGYIKLLNIGRYPDRLVNNETGEVLGEKVSFVYFGGWFLNYTGLVVLGDRCHGYSVGKEGGYYQDFLIHIFIKAGK